MRTLSLFFVLVFSMSLVTAEELTRTHVNVRLLSAEAANKIAMAAYEHCLGKGYNVSVSVVSREGRSLAFVRSELAGAHTIKTAEGKAYAAASFRTPTTQLMGRDFMRDIPDVLIIGGGLPINVGGHFYGAVGVSGAPALKKTGDMDEECAKAGIAAVSTDLEMAE